MDLVVDEAGAGEQGVIAGAAPVAAINPHGFLFAQEVPVVYDAKILDWQFHNMPSSVSEDEHSRIMLLKAVNEDGAATDVNMIIGKLHCVLQTWHYKNSNTMGTERQQGAKNIQQFDYVDFADLRNKPEYYRWQKFHAMTIRSKDNDGLRFTNRLYLARCMWYFVALTPDGLEVICKDFVIVALMRSRCVLTYLASLIGHIPSGTIYFLNETQTASFMKSGWSAPLDPDYDQPLWDRKEAERMAPFVYDHSNKIGIDITMTENIPNRPEMKNYQIIYDSWIIAPGRKISGAQLAGMGSFSRQPQLSIGKESKDKIASEFAALQAEQKRIRDEKAKLSKVRIYLSCLFDTLYVCCPRHKQLCLTPGMN